MMNQIQKKILEIIINNKKESTEKINYPKEETQEEEAKDSNIINLGKVFNIDSTVKKKEINYPKESQSKSKNKSKNSKKKTPSYSEVKSKVGSKISGIKELKKYWASTHKGKSVNTITKNKNDLEKDKASKNTALTMFINNNIKMDNEFNIEETKNDKKKETQTPLNAQKQEEIMDLFLEEIYKNHEKKIRDTPDLNPKSEYDQYEKDLMVNLHNVNMRRPFNDNESKKSLIEQIDMPGKKFQSDNKRKSDFGRNHFKENMDENIVNNINDKTPLI